MRAIIIRDGHVLVMHRDKFGHEYYTLLGGGIDPRETPDHALQREIAEESGFHLRSARLVFIEEAGHPYGTQYIYLCEADGDQPVLSPETEEAKLFAHGNKHTPMWLPIEKFASVAFRTPLLQRAILRGLEYGFPNQPVTLSQEFLDKLQTNIAKRGQM